MVYESIGRRRPIERVQSTWDDYPLDAVCLHPECTNMCHITFDRAGPKQKFCSYECRVDYGRKHKHLARERALLMAAIDALPGPECRQVVPLRQQLVHLEWLLLRYPQLRHAPIDRQ